MNYKTGDVARVLTKEELINKYGKEIRIETTSSPWSPFYKYKEGTINGWMFSKKEVKLKVINNNDNVYNYINEGNGDHWLWADWMLAEPNKQLELDFDI